MECADRHHKKKRRLSPSFFLWCHRELNQGHTDFQSVALPTELWHLWFGSANIGLKCKTPKNYCGFILIFIPGYIFVFLVKPLIVKISCRVTPSN